MKNFIRDNKNNLIVLLFLIVGFLIRIFFVDKVVMGDLLFFEEWGQKLVELGTKSHYFRSGWYYTPPVYPPVSQLYFGAMYWLYEHKYVLAQMHNTVKFPPSFFIVYFYRSGYVLLLKLLAILSDLGLSLIAYRIIFKVTGSFKKSMLGLSLVLFNPVTIFLSSVWGQNDSTIAILGMISFLLLEDGNALFSLPLLFLSIYFKPNWAIFIPFYLFLAYIRKPKAASILGGIVVSIILFLLTTAPFSNGNVISFAWELFTKKLPLPIGIIGKASNSAFNFQTIFLRIDIDYSSTRLLGFPSNAIGLVLFLVTNFLACLMIKKKRSGVLGIMGGLFAIGMGAFLFLASMLERYFFPAFVPMIILLITKPRLLLKIIIINVVNFSNLVWSFYRRTSDEIGHPFTNNNFLLIRFLSSAEVLAYILTMFYLLKHTLYRLQKS